MATVVVTNGVVTAGGNDISSDVNRAVWEYGAESLDETAFGDTTRIMLGGIKTWSITLEGHNDYAAAGPGAVFFTAVGTTMAITTKQSTAGTAVTNPLYSGTGLLTEYSPAQMVQGELQPFRAVLVNAGTLTQDVA